jgi:hypothetical protein
MGQMISIFDISVNLVKMKLRYLKIYVVGNLNIQVDSSTSNNWTKHTRKKQYLHIRLFPLV